VIRYIQRALFSNSEKSGQLLKGFTEGNNTVVRSDLGENREQILMEEKWREV
jgi:hypothetical protein